MPGERWLRGYGLSVPRLILGLSCALPPGGRPCRKHPVHFWVPSTLGVGIDDGLHPPFQHLETQKCSAVQLIRQCSIEQCVSDFPQFVEGSITVTQPLLALLLLEPEPRITTMLQDILHKAQH